MKIRVPDHCQSVISSLKNNTPKTHGTMRPAVENTIVITMVPLCIANIEHSCAKTRVIPESTANPAVIQSKVISSVWNTSVSMANSDEQPNSKTIHMACPYSVVGDSELVFLLKKFCTIRITNIKISKLLPYLSTNFLCLFMQSGMNSPRITHSYYTIVFSWTGFMGSCPGDREEKRDKNPNDTSQTYT